LTRNRYQLTAYRPEPSCLEETRLNIEVEGDVVSAHIDIRPHAQQKRFPNSGHGK
jgi:hypothetical protein